VLHRYHASRMLGGLGFDEGVVDHDIYKIWYQALYDLLGRRFDQVIGQTVGGLSLVAPLSALRPDSFHNVLDLGRVKRQDPAPSGLLLEGREKILVDDPHRSVAAIL